MSPSRPAAIHHARIETAFCPLLAARTERGLAWVSFEGPDSPGSGSTRLERWRDEHEPGAPLVEDASALAEVARQLHEYAGGRRREFELELDLRGSEFQRAVWQALLEIEFGRTRTYGELAASLGSPGASRAVGTAAGRNPVPVIVPCHRLLSRDGLGGFSGGLANKERLLALEGVVFSVLEE